MGQVLIRNLDDAVIESLKAKASGENKSLEQFLREMLTRQAKPSNAEALARLKALREDIDISPDTPLPEDMIREEREKRSDHVWRVSQGLD